MRAFAVDFAYYIHIEKLGECSHEKHKKMFDEWIKPKLPQADVGGQLLANNCQKCGKSGYYMGKPFCTDEHCNGGNLR